MPRAENKTQSSYQSFPNTSPYPALTDPLAAHVPAHNMPAPVPPAQKKKHICSICERSFSTSGHLSRHARVHTGERNHKCPFPGCETRCSRQDNLQQHYRIHLSPGSRRNSKSRVLATTAKRSSAILDLPPRPPSPPLSPPRLEPARMYMPHSTPPDSPPPLAQAPLPIAHPVDSLSGTAPDTSYSAVSQHSLVSPGLPPNYSSYHAGTSYGESSQFSYVNDSSSSNAAFPSYNNSHDYETQHLPHLNTVIPPSHSHSPSPVSSISIGSRHSIAHISHPYNGTNPPSPASSHSISSHPPTPPLTYSIYDDYQHGNSSVVSEQLPLSAHIPQHHSPHVTYSPTMAIPPPAIPTPPRFPSPPPVLAPLQGNIHNNQPQYLHHSHSDFSGYRHSYSHHHHHHHPRHLSLGHEAWKNSKGIEGLVQ